MIVINNSYIINNNHSQTTQTFRFSYYLNMILYAFNERFHVWASIHNNELI